jgi:monoterpene epsilon-lactone hydrolase
MSKEMQKPASIGAKGNAAEVHPLDPDDAPINAAIRAMSSAGKGVVPGPEARGQYDALIGSVLPRDDVIFEADTIGGVAGMWVLPQGGQAGKAILHLHGGWFNFGSAEAYCNLVGHVAARAGARAFIPNYRLAPEHPFPAAAEDALASYRGLAKSNVHRLAITGDSAGGNLALGLASRIAAGEGAIAATLAGVAVMSPVTDLTLSSETYDTRADADPLFTRPQVAELVRSYLAHTDSANPLASPLYGRLAGMPPVRIHVGDDEVLLDDSRRYIDKAVGAGVDARLAVWMGMPHGFVVSVGKLKAASLCLDAIGAFLAERHQAHTSS